MKEVFEALARYKQNVDGIVIGLVEKLDEDRLLAPSGAFFPNAFVQLKHIFGSDVNWIKRLKAALPSSPALARNRFADYELDSLKAQPVAERGKFFADMRELDREILAFVIGLDEASLSSTVEFKNYKGVLETHELWKVLMQWFNHGSHHRGAISGQLDALGVENDYSSFLAHNA